MQHPPSTNWSTNQAGNSVNDLIAPQFNRTRFEPGYDIALPFLSVVKNEGGCSEGEREAEKDSVDQEPNICAVLWLEQRGDESLQTVQVE